MLYLEFNLAMAGFRIVAIQYTNQHMRAHACSVVGSFWPPCLLCKLIVAATSWFSRFSGGTVPVVRLGSQDTKLQRWSLLVECDQRSRRVGHTELGRERNPRSWN